eukprot:gene2581-2621_t
MSHAILRLATVLLLSAAATQAFAQTSSTDRLLKGPIVSRTGEGTPGKAAPPPGLPGAQLNKDRVAPSERAATDMPPTEALFDSINRGDIAAARDAIARGADYNARNVLGLTPLDQSIDLSRNDITFLLLSLRGSSAPQVASGPASGEKKPSKEAAARPAPKPAPVAAPPRPVAQAQRPQQAGGGTPNPQSGFLGFGG